MLCRRSILARRGDSRNLRCVVSTLHVERRSWPTPVESGGHDSSRADAAAVCFVKLNSREWKEDVDIRREEQATRAARVNDVFDHSM